MPLPSWSVPGRSRRTKVVATLGPATATRTRIAELVNAGVDVFRLNFSHGMPEEHAERIRLIREIEAQTGLTVGILQDVQGPKIRLGEVPEGGITLQAGQRFLLEPGERVANPTRASVSYARLTGEVLVGTVVLMDEGRLELLVEETTPDHLVCRVVVGGTLRPHMGVNFPGVSLSIGALTDKDRRDIAFGVEHGIDWLAVSFVQRSQDVAETRDYLATLGSRVPIIAKIERKEAVHAIEGILQEADGIMVARGDLGVEIPTEQVPLVQKRIIKRCNTLGKPVITATQMLDSMAHAPRPTRAEASDVANAILDGTDAVMLSNETAIGEFPVEAVETMVRIARQTETVLGESRGEAETDRDSTAAISTATCQIARLLDARVIITATQTGATTRQVARHHPARPILAATPSPATCRVLKLVWGVIPMLIPDVRNTDELMAAVLRQARAFGHLQSGDTAVITAGIPLGETGSTNLIKVEKVL